LSKEKTSKLEVSLDVYNNIPNPSTDQHLNVVAKWLENNPQEWHEDKDVCIVRALRDAYGMKE
jgi:hypothetical protein